MKVQAAGSEPAGNTCRCRRHFGCHNWGGCSCHLMGRGQGCCCISYSAQECPPPHRVIQPQMSILPVGELCSISLPYFIATTFFPSEKISYLLLYLIDSVASVSTYENITSKKAEVWFVLFIMVPLLLRTAPATS